MTHRCWRLGKRDTRTITSIIRWQRWTKWHGLGGWSKKLLIDLFWAMENEKMKLFFLVLVNDEITLNLVCKPPQKHLEIIVLFWYYVHTANISDSNKSQSNVFLAWFETLPFYPSPIWVLWFSSHYSRQSLEDLYLFGHSENFWDILFAISNFDFPVWQYSRL